MFSGVEFDEQTLILEINRYLNLLVWEGWVEAEKHELRSTNFEYQELFYM